MNNEISWDTLFAEAERVTGQPLEKAVQKHWKNKGKPWALQTIHALARNNGRSTTLPFFCPRKGGSHISRS